VVFGAAVNVTDPLPDPVPGATVNQPAPADTLTLQVVFDVTDRGLVPPAAATFHAVVGEIVKVGAAGFWFTVTVLVTWELPAVVVNVTVALRALVEVFVAAVNVTEPLPVPLVGAAVNQLAPGDTLTAQVVFDVTDRGLEPPATATSHAVVGEIVKVGAAGAWFTVTVLVTCGLPAVVVNVTVALRELVEVFAAAVNVTEPPPVPVSGATVNQLAPAETLTAQVVFDITDRGLVPPATATSHAVVGEIVKVGATGAWFTVTVLVTGGMPAVVVNVTVALRD